MCTGFPFFNPPAIPTVPPSGVGNPFSGGGGTSFNTPGFGRFHRPAFIASCNATGVNPAAQELPASLLPRNPRS